MNEEELKTLENVIGFLGGGYNVISLDRVEILEKSLTYIKQLEKENEELQKKYLDESYDKSKLVKENAELKDKIKQCNKLLYSDEISDSEICSKIMEIL